MTRHKLRASLVLTHLLNDKNEPNAESRARADKAAQMFLSGGFDYIITSGWSFETKLQRPVAALMKDYIFQTHHIDERKIFNSPRSRDTVGDAVFCRADIVEPLNICELHVVTSAYHLARTQAIFNFVFNNKIILHMHGVQIDVGTDTHKHEQTSLAAFRETFKGQNADDVNALIQTMAIKHPFYNGEIYPRIE